RNCPKPQTDLRPPENPMSQNPAPASQPAPAGPHQEAGDSEEIYYEGSPLVRGQLAKVILCSLIGIVLIAVPFTWHHFQKDHQWPGGWVTAVCVILGLLFLAIPILIVKSLRYRISNYRIDFERGILGKKIDTLELWHVEDIRFEQSFVDRLLGVG